jgi:chromosome segregation ATPase
MKHFILAAGCLLMLLSLEACVSSTETDPRKGGLFGYNPKAYEKRLEEKKATLATTEADTQNAKLATQNLETTKQEKLADHEALKTKLAALYSESGKLQKQLEQVKATNSGQEKELKRLQDQVAVLRTDTIKTNNANTTDAAKQAEINRLQQHMDKLLEEAAALSAL